MDIVGNSKRTASDAKIIALADYLTADFASPIIPIKRIAESRGVDVVFESFKHHPDVAGLCDFSGKLLFVNEDESFEEQMFTIAHELGHWELHKEIFDPSSEKYRTDLEYEVLMRNHSIQAGDSPLEDEANLFARHLLVPTHLLKWVAHLSDGKLANMFDVTELLIKLRKSELPVG